MQKMRLVIWTRFGDYFFFLDYYVPVFYENKMIFFSLVAHEKKC